MGAGRSFTAVCAISALISFTACEQVVDPHGDNGAGATRVVAATTLPGDVVANLRRSDPPVGDTWRGVSVAPEDRCSKYVRDDYRYSQSIEQHIAHNLGGWWSPYDGATFTNQESDIEHIVSLSEAHDSGLCEADPETRRRFASDLDNLTLASPRLNRSEKRGYDAAEWQPEQNVCWFAGRVLAVRLEYDLTVNRSEAYALEGMLSGCSIEQILRPSKRVGG